VNFKTARLSVAVNGSRPFVTEARELLTVPSSAQGNAPGAVEKGEAALLALSR
jgi:hypothetical protein